MAIMVEEGTTNLLTANQSSVETDLAGFIAYGSVISRDISEYYHGSASLKVVTNNSGAWEGFLIDKINASPNLPYSLQMRLKGSGTIGIEFRAFDAAGQYLGSKWHSGLITLTSAWQLVKIQNFVTPSNTAWLDVYIYTPSQQAATIYYDCGQIEQKAYATSWTLGGTTRSPETLTIPTAGVLNPQEGTIEGWFYLNDTNSAHYSPLFTTFASVAAPGPRLLIMRDLGSGKLAVWDGDGTSESFYTGTTVIQPKTWYHFAFTWSSTGRKLYLNGVLCATDTRTTPIGMSDNAKIGSWGDYLNGLIDDLRISSRARTDAEISAAYSSNAPLSVDEYTTYKLPFDSSLTPSQLLLGDPNGGYKLLDKKATDFELILYTRRDSGTGLNAYSITDSSGNGYGITLDYSGNLTIDKRTAWARSVIHSTPVLVSPGTWYILHLTKIGSNITAEVSEVYTEQFSVSLASIAVNDKTYTSFDRIAVNGDYVFFTDNVTVKKLL